MANGHGGARAGAGRPPEDVRDWRRRMARLLAVNITEKQAKQIIDTWTAMLIQGDPNALWLVDRIFGKVAVEIEQAVAGIVRVEVVYGDRGPLDTRGSAQAALGPGEGQE